MMNKSKDDLRLSDHDGRLSQDGRYSLDGKFEEEDDVRELYANRCRFLCRSVQICTCNLFGGGNIGDDFEMG
jgi:hypothetical protein